MKKILFVAVAMMCAAGVWADFNLVPNEKKDSANSSKRYEIIESNPKEIPEWVMTIASGGLTSSVAKDFGMADCKPFGFLRSSSTLDEGALLISADIADAMGTGIKSKKARDALRLYVMYLFAYETFNPTTSIESELRDEKKRFRKQEFFETKKAETLICRH